MFNPYNQDMNNSPVVKVVPTVTAFKQTDQNAAPVVKAAPSKAAFSMPSNGVTDGSSTRLQKATKLPGRVTINGAKKNFE